MRKDIFRPVFSGFDFAAMLVPYGVPASAFKLLGHGAKGDYHLTTGKYHYKTVRSSVFVQVVKPVRVYKAARLFTWRRNIRYGRTVLVTLNLIPGALVHMQRCHAGNEHSHKCRASLAYVEDIHTIEHSKKLLRLDKRRVAHSDHNKCFEYKRGGIVMPLGDFDTEANTCSTGIHFFFDKKLAINYL